MSHYDTVEAENRLKSQSCLTRVVTYVTSKTPSLHLITFTSWNHIRAKLHAYQ